MRAVSPDEVRRAVDGLLLGFPGRFEHLSGVAGRFATLPLYQRPLDWYSRWPSRVWAQTTQAVNDVVRSSGNLDEYVVVVAGDRRQVEPSLRGLPMQLHRVDAQGRPVHD
jgi:predicted Zn-dependent peptidase